MLFGPSYIIECSHCSYQVSFPCVMSRSSMGATFWSDGRIQGPMWVNLPSIVQCPKCGNFYRVAQPVEPEKQKKVYRNCRFLQFEDWVKAMAEMPQEQELVFLHLWLSYNDLFRRNIPTTSKQQDMFRKCALRMLRKARWRRVFENHIESTIQQAELLRELGLFERCLSLSKHYRHLPEYADQIAQIREAAQRQDSTVFRCTHR